MISSGFRSTVCSLAIGVLLVFTAIAAGEGSNEVSNVKQVHHMPENPRLDETLRVTLEFQNISHILTVQIFICSMEQLFCFYADDMNYVGNNTFESIIDYQDRDFKAGTVIGYNFKIKYNDNTTEKFPNSPTLEGYENILEVADDVYYFTFTIAGNGVEGNNKDDADSVAIYMAIVLSSSALIVAAVAILLVRARSKKEQRSEIGDDKIDET